MHSKARATRPTAVRGPNPDSANAIADPMEQEGVTRRLLQLTCLALDIVQVILDGRLKMLGGPPSGLE